MKRKTKGVPSSVYDAVVERDCGCVAQRSLPEVLCFGRLDPHHVLRRSQGGHDTEDNLITLCSAHHRWVHEHPAKSYEMGYLKRSGLAAVDENPEIFPFRVDDET